MLNFNTKVTRKEAPMKTFNRASLFTNSLSGYQKEREEAALEAARQNEIALESAKAEREAMNAKILEQNFIKSARPVILERLYNEGSRLLFKVVMTECFRGCLETDDDFKEFYTGNLINLVESYVDENKIYESLEANHRKTQFLSDVYEACSKTAHTTAIRKAKEVGTREEITTIKFEMNDTEKEDFGKKLSKMNIDSLGKLVKGKVVDVLLDEKKRAEAKKDFDEDLRNGVDKAVNESTTMNLSKKLPTLNTTLFDSLMENTYKRALESIVKSHSDEDSSIGVDADEVDYQATPGAEQSDTDWTNANAFEDNSDDEVADSFGGDAPETEDRIEDDSNQTSESDPIEDQHYDNTNSTLEGCKKPCKEDTDEDVEGEEVDEALNMKKRIHKRAKLFKNKIMRKGTREGVDIDSVFLEAFSRYTLMEMMYTIQLESFDSSAVKSRVQSLLMNK